MPKYLDLFAGAGGLSEGFTRAGYEPVAHVEMDKAACFTLRTRAAYHWLKKENKLDIYNRYLNGLMTRDKFYKEIPESVLGTVAELEIHQVRRGFAYRKETKSLQMSGKNSRLGSKDLAKGGLTCDQVKRMEEVHGDTGKSFSENFYFSTGIKRNPLLVIYPVHLYYEPKDGEKVDEVKKAITNSLNFPAIGLSIGIPKINGLPPKRIKYKINKQKWLEIFGTENADDFAEIDETIPED